MKGSDVLCSLPDASAKCSCHIACKPGDDLITSSAEARATLLRPVVHDRNARRNRVNQRRAVALIYAVMRDNEEIGLSELIRRANQFQLLVPGKVAEVYNTEPAELDNAPERTGIFGLDRLPFSECPGKRDWVDRHPEAGSRSPCRQRKRR